MLYADKGGGGPTTSAFSSLCENASLDLSHTNSAVLFTDYPRQLLHFHSFDSIRQVWFVMPPSWDAEKKLCKPRTAL